MIQTFLSSSADNFASSCRKIPPSWRTSKAARTANSGTGHNFFFTLNVHISKRIFNLAKFGKVRMLEKVPSILSLWSLICIVSAAFKHSLKVIQTVDGQFIKSIVYRLIQIIHLQLFYQIWTNYLIICTLQIRICKLLANFQDKVSVTLNISPN